MTSSTVFWKQKRESLKIVSLTFFKLQSILTRFVCGERRSSIALVHSGANLINNKFVQWLRFLLSNKRFGVLILNQFFVILPL